MKYPGTLKVGVIFKPASKRDSSISPSYNAVTRSGSTLAIFPDVTKRKKTCNAEFAENTRNIRTFFKGNCSLNIRV